MFSILDRFHFGEAVPFLVSDSFIIFQSHSSLTYNKTITKFVLQLQFLPLDVIII